MRRLHVRDGCRASRYAAAAHTIDPAPAMPPEEERADGRSRQYTHHKTESPERTLIAAACEYGIRPDCGQRHRQHRRVHLALAHPAYRGIPDTHCHTSQRDDDVDTRGGRGRSHRQAAGHGRRHQQQRRFTCKRGRWPAMHRRNHRSRESYPQHCAEQKRGERRHRTTD